MRIGKHQIRFGLFGRNRRAGTDAMSVNISAGFNGNLIVSRVAQKLGGFGNKQLVYVRLALQQTVKMQIADIDRTDDGTFKTDNQFFASNIAFDAAVNMDNAVADDVAGKLGIFADDARNGHRRRIVQLAGKFQISETF